MSQSCGNLIRKRDELIDQLQGEWDIQRDKSKVNRLALRAARILFASGFCFLILLYVVMYPFREVGADYSLGPLLLVLVPFLGFFALVTYASIRFYGMWCRRLQPLAVDGSQLVWNKKKGYVPERLDLHNLTKVYGYEGQGVGGGAILVWIMKHLDESAFDSVNPCQFISAGDHNPPKIAPGMFNEGKKLIDLLEQIASINTQINELTQGSSG